MADFSKYSNEQLTTIKKKRQSIEFEAQRLPGIRGVIEAPGAAIKSAIRAPFGKKIEAYKKGAISPGSVESFQEQALKSYYGSFKDVPPTTETFGKILREQFIEPAGMGVSAAGLAADIATDPYALLLTLGGKVPGAKQALKSLKGTKPVQAIGKFATKKRALPSFKSIGRSFRKFKQHPYTNPKRVQNIIARKKALRGRLGQQETEYFNRISQQTDDILNNNIEVMKVELQHAAEKGSLEIQPKLKQFIKDNSKAYGKHIDNISEGLVQRGESLTKSEITDVFSRTLKEGVEAELPIGRAQTLIENLLTEKYQISKVTKHTFRDIFNDIKAISNTLKGAAQAGRTGFTADEVIVSILKKNWGDLIVQRVPEFAKLQSSYAPVIQTIKKSHKIFKPYQGSLETKTGSQFLKRAGFGELEAGEARFLTQLEKGKKGFAKGIGRISKEPKAIGAKIELTEQIKPTTRIAIGKQRQIFQGKKGKEIQRWMGKLSDIEKKAVLNQWMARGTGVAGGSYLLYLIKRQAANSLLNSLSGGGLSQQQGQQF